jgi:uncharacterized protein
MQLSSPVPSPCIGICRMSPATGLCEGCHRTAWSRMEDHEKRAVWNLIDERRIRLGVQPAREGQA